MGLWPIDTGWNLLGTLEKVPYFCGVALTELWHEDLNWLVFLEGCFDAFILCHENAEIYKLAKKLKDCSFAEYLRNGLDVYAQLDSSGDFWNTIMCAHALVYAWTTMWRCLLQWLTPTKISFPKHVGLSENLGADPKSGDVSSFLQNYHVGVPHFRTTHYRRTTSHQLCHQKWHLGNFTCDTYCCGSPTVESSGDVCAVCDHLGNCQMRPCAAAGSRLEYVFERIGQSIGSLDLLSRWCVNFPR